MYHGAAFGFVNNIALEAWEDGYHYMLMQKAYIYTRKLPVKATVTNAVIKAFDLWDIGMGIPNVVINVTYVFLLHLDYNSHFKLIISSEMACRHQHQFPASFFQLFPPFPPLLAHLQARCFSSESSLLQP
jgi:hypothetical protein